MDEGSYPETKVEADVRPTPAPSTELSRIGQEYDAGIMRAILTAMLLLAATSAWAEWVKVTETGDTVFYVDPAAIGSKGDLRQASVIHDYAKQEPGGVRSRQVSYEIDCIGGRLRSVSVTEYSEPLGRGGRMSSRERESEWLYVAPRTGSNIASNATYRAILRFVCSR